MHKNIKVHNATMCSAKYTIITLIKPGIVFMRDRNKIQISRKHAKDTNTGYKINAKMPKTKFVQFIQEFC